MLPVRRAVAALPPGLAVALRLKPRTRCRSITRSRPLRPRCDTSFSSCSPWAQRARGPSPPPRGLGALAAFDGDGDSYDEPGRWLLVSLVSVAAGSVYSFATLDDTLRERDLVLAPVRLADGGAGLMLSARF